MLIRFSTSGSELTSQRTKVTEGESELARAVPEAASMSPIRTLAPCLANNLTVASPIPLAPPVTIAIFPSNLLGDGGGVLSLGNM